MAKFKMGPVVGDVSGALGNVVFSRNRYGPVMRVRVVPVKVVSDYTVDIHGRLATLSQAWSALDPENMVAWKTWAEENPITDRLGDKRVLQPSAAFIGLNMRIIGAGGTQIDVPPLDPAPGSPGELTVVAENTPNLVTVATANAPAAGQCCQIWACVLDSAGRTYYKNRLKSVFISSAAAAGPHDITTEMVARFGELLTGAVVKVHAQFVDNTTGLVGGVSIGSSAVIVHAA